VYVGRLELCLIMNEATLQTRKTRNRVR
jgi:hypothetical protein